MQDNTVFFKRLDDGCLRTRWRPERHHTIILLFILDKLYYILISIYNNCAQ